MFELTLAIAHESVTYRLGPIEIMDPAAPADTEYSEEVRKVIVDAALVVQSTKKRVEARWSKWTQR